MAEAEQSTEQDVEEGDIPISAGDYVPPVFLSKAFHCPHCGVYTSHQWVHLTRPSVGQFVYQSPVRTSTCQNCRAITVWLYESDPAIMLWPEHTDLTPRPYSDMPDDCKVDYEEARAIVGRSPRGAAALLRLTVQKLMVHLGEPGEDINTDIGSQVKKGLPVEVQQALDAVRVIGNESVHPGVMDLKDDAQTAATLFGLLNFIVDQRITQPKKLNALYDSLPADKLAGIRARDKNANNPSES